MFAIYRIIKKSWKLNFLTNSSEILHPHFFPFPCLCPNWSHHSNTFVANLIGPFSVPNRFLIGTNPNQGRFSFTQKPSGNLITIFSGRKIFSTQISRLFFWREIGDYRFLLFKKIQYLPDFVFSSFLFMWENGNRGLVIKV